MNILNLDVQAELFNTSWNIDGLTKKVNPSISKKDGVFYFQESPAIKINPQLKIDDSDFAIMIKFKIYKPQNETFLFSHLSSICISYKKDILIISDNTTFQYLEIPLKIEANKYSKIVIVFLENGKTIIVQDSKKTIWTGFKHSIKSYMFEHIGNFWSRKNQLQIGFKMLKL
jgi:hypothetical protein